MKAQLQSLGKIGVLLGGESAEREISLRSGNAVLAALQTLGANAVAIDVRFNDELFRQLREIDVAFIALHGRGGEDGVIQGLLEIMGIPYTGSGVAASALGMDKLRTKWLWQGAGLPTPEFFAVGGAEQLPGMLQKLGGSVMVKPCHEGSSIGMARASSDEELQQAFNLAQGHDSEILVERWITGQEFTCAILDGRALPVIRLRTPNKFYDYEAKYQAKTTQYLIPCGLTQEQESQLQNLCLRAFDTVGCSGWGRVDAMMDEQGRFWLLEVNTIPGMTDHSLVPMAAKAVGMSFEELVAGILLAKKGRA